MDERASRGVRGGRPPTGHLRSARSALGAADRCPELFDRRIVRLDPGAVRVIDPAEWEGALVVLASGDVELEGSCGTRVPLSAGALLWFSGLPLRLVRNVGAHPATLVAVARRADAPD